MPIAPYQDDRCTRHDRPQATDGGEPPEEHEIERRATGSIHDRYTLGKRNLVHLGSDLSYHETTDVECTCGEVFDDLDEARQHLVSVDDEKKGLCLDR